MWFVLSLILLLLALAAPARAQTPTDAPILRIETGMHTAPIRRISVTADGRLLATGSDDNTVRLWSLPDGRLLRTFRPAIGEANEGKVFAVAIDPAGRWIAAGGRTQAGPRHFISIFDISTGAIIRRLGPLPRGIGELRVSPDGRRLAAGLGGQSGIRVWDTDTWRSAFEDTDFGDSVYGLDFAADGRLFATSDDGHVRLYGPDGQRRAKLPAPGGERPFGIAVSPDGRRVAVGYWDPDLTRVDVLDATTLRLQFSTDTSGLDNGNLSRVRWLDGARLAAAGTHEVHGRKPILIWANGGRGTRSAWTGPSSTVTEVAALPGEARLAYSASDPAFGIVDGSVRLFRGPPQADLRVKLRQNFQVSSDGRRLHFGLGRGSDAPVRLDLGELTALPSPAVPTGLQPADSSSLDIKGWENTTNPTLGNKPLDLQQHETARSLTILPGRRSFILGTDWYLHRFSHDGIEEWAKPVPAPAWGVHTAREGRLVIAAYGDGTIRWHRASDGQELLAVFLHVERIEGKQPTVKGIVAWTPRGYYQASPGAEDIIGWHVNNGLDKAADFFPASRFRERFNRPDIVQRVLDDLDEDKAIEVANAEARRRRDDGDLQLALPPIVEILSPGDGASVTGSTLRVAYAVRSPSGQPVTGIEVLIDGRPLTGEAVRGLSRSEGVSLAGTQSITIPIPAKEFDLAILARTARAAGEASRRRIVVATAAASPTPSPQIVADVQDELKPKLYALVIGVSAYTNPAVGKLEYAAKDARDFAAQLTRQPGGMYGADAKAERIRILTDQDATPEAIRDGFDWLAKSVTQRDVAVVFLAGHGETDLQQNYWYYPVGADPARLRATAIARAEFEGVLRGLPSKVLMFIDTCHAGRGIERQRVASAGASAVDMTKLVNELTAVENGIVMFASSTGRQLSNERADWGNGAFTKAVVEGLSGRADYNRDGRIAITELDAWIAARVKELTEGRQHPVTRKPDTIPDFPIAVVR